MYVTKIYMTIENNVHLSDKDIHCDSLYKIMFEFYFIENIHKNVSHI